MFAAGHSAVGSGRRGARSQSLVTYDEDGNPVWEVRPSPTTYCLPRDLCRMGSVTLCRPGEERPNQALGESKPTLPTPTPRPCGRPSSARRNALECGCGGILEILPLFFPTREDFLYRGDSCPQLICLRANRLQDENDDYGIEVGTRDTSVLPATLNPRIDDVPPSPNCTRGLVLMDGWCCPPSNQWEVAPTSSRGGLVLA